MLNVEFLNAEIVSLLGNLLYSRVIYLKNLLDVMRKETCDVDENLCRIA